jgi:hypothetical protein
LLLENLSRSLDSSLDTGLYPSLSLLTSATLAYVETGRTKLSDVGDLSLIGSPSRQGKLPGTAPRVKMFDFYRDGFVEEVRQCLPVLMAVSSRVEELLADWPDHPTLKQVSRRMRWACDTNCRLLVEKPEGKRPLGKPRCKWVDNIKIYLSERVAVH